MASTIHAFAQPDMCTLKFSTINTGTWAHNRSRSEGMGKRIQFVVPFTSLLITDHTEDEHKICSKRLFLNKNLIGYHVIASFYHYNNNKIIIIIKLSQCSRMAFTSTSNFQPSACSWAWLDESSKPRIQFLIRQCCSKLLSCVKSDQLSCIEKKHWGEEWAISLDIMQAVINFQFCKVFLCWRGIKCFICGRWFWIIFIITLTINLKQVTCTVIHIHGTSDNFSIESLTENKNWTWNSNYFNKFTFWECSFSKKWYILDVWCLLFNFLCIFIPATL